MKIFLSVDLTTPQKGWFVQSQTNTFCVVCMHHHHVLYCIINIVISHVISLFWDSWHSTQWTRAPISGYLWGHSTMYPRGSTGCTPFSPVADFAITITMPWLNLHQYRLLVVRATSLSNNCATVRFWRPSLLKRFPLTRYPASSIATLPPSLALLVVCRQVPPLSQHHGLVIPANSLIPVDIALLLSCLALMSPFLRGIVWCCREYYLIYTHLCKVKRCQFTRPKM